MLRSGTASHLFSASTQPAALALDQAVRSADPVRESPRRHRCRAQRSPPSSSALNRRGTAHLLQPDLNPRLLPQTRPCRPIQSGRRLRRKNAPPTESRRQSWLRPGDHPLFAEQVVQQGRFPRIRAARRWRGGGGGPTASSRPAALATRSAISPIKFARPSPCSAETARGSPNPRLYASSAACAPPLPSALLATSSTGRPWLAQPGGEMAVCGRDAGAGVHHEHHQVCGCDGSLRTGAHAAEQRFGRAFLQPGGVDQAHHPAAQLRRGVLAVARDPGRVGDQGEPAAGQPVEQRALADVRPASDDDIGAGPNAWSSRAGPHPAVPTAHWRP